MTVGSKVKQALYSLKSTRGTLEIYALQTRDEKAVSAYKEALGITDEVINDLEKRIRTLELEEPQYKGL